MFRSDEIEGDPFGAIRRLSELVGELIVENRTLTQRVGALESVGRKLPLDDEHMPPIAPTLN